jgi:outer membrane protein OmpA-like peptidoglycan-associated protein
MGTRLKAVGYGKSKPLVKGTSEAARAQNRRVEMTITSESD